MLPQPGIVTQILRRYTADDLLGVGHQTIQLLVAANIELAEPLEELGQVLDYAVAELCGVQDYVDRRVTCLLCWWCPWLRTAHNHSSLRNCISGLT